MAAAIAISVGPLFKATIASPHEHEPTEEALAGRTCDEYRERLIGKADHSEHNPSAQRLVCICSPRPRNTDKPLSARRIDPHRDGAWRSRKAVPMHPERFARQPRDACAVGTQNHCLSGRGQAMKRSVHLVCELSFTRKDSGISGS
jgi:hypothetical protein